MFIFIKADTCWSDIIVFKDGREITSELVWQEGDIVKCILHGNNIGFPLTSIERFESSIKDEGNKKKEKKAFPSLPQYDNFPEDDAAAYSIYKNTPVLEHECYRLKPDPILNKVKTCNIVLREYYKSIEGPSVNKEVLDTISSWLEILDIDLLQNTSQKADMTITADITGVPLSHEYMSVGSLYTGASINIDIHITIKTIGTILKKNLKGGVRPPRSKVFKDINLPKYKVSFSSIAQRESYIKEHQNPVNAPFLPALDNCHLGSIMAELYAKKYGADALIDLLCSQEPYKFSDLLRKNVLRGSKIVELIIDRIKNDRSIGYRSKLISILAHIGDCRAIAPLSQLLLNSTNSEIQGKIISAFYHKIDCRDIKINNINNCLERVNDPALKVRLQALKETLVADIPKNGYLDSNLRIVNNPDISLQNRSVSLSCIGKNGGHQSIKFLENILLSDNEMKLRIIAVHALGEIGSPLAVNALIKGYSLPLGTKKSYSLGKEHYVDDLSYSEIPLWAEIAKALFKTHDFRAWQILEYTIKYTDEDKTRTFIASLFDDKL